MLRLADRPVVLLCGLMLALHPAAHGQTDASRTQADHQGDPLPAGTVARLGTVRFRHGHFITSIAFSPDGRILAAGDGQKNLLLWEAATGKVLHRYPGLGWATSQSFSPDGQSLALADYGGRLALVEV